MEYNIHLLCSPVRTVVFLRAYTLSPLYLHRDWVHHYREAMLCCYGNLSQAISAFYDFKSANTDTKNQCLNLCDCKYLDVGKREIFRPLESYISDL